MNRLRAILLLAVIGACVTSAHRNAQVDLAGVVRDSLTDTPLVGAQVFLTEDTTVLHGPPRRWPRGVVTDSVGRFAFHSVEPGSYVLHARFIGFGARWLRVTVPPSGDGFVVLRLLPATIRLGYWPPDSAEVASNRARMPEWTCQTEEPDGIEFVRKQWIEMLADRQPVDWDSLLVAQGLTRDSAEIARLLLHVTDPQICRRAGRGYDQTLGATDIHFLVFGIGQILIVANPWGGWGTVLLDREYRMLRTFIVE